MGMIHRLIDMAKYFLEAEGRELREQVYRVSLSLIVTCVAILLLLAGLITGGVAAYCGLRHVMGPGQAMGVITLAILLLALILGITGFRLYPGHESYQRAQARRRERERERKRLASQARGTSFSGQARPDVPLPPEGQGVYPPALMGQHARPGQPSPGGLDQPLQVVRKYPLATMAAAFGLGLLASRSSLTREAIKAGVVWGGRQYLERFIFPPR